MIDVAGIKKIVGEKLAGTDMFLVDIRQTPANEIEVLIDSDSVVGIDACVTLSRALNAAFDRDEEDFELTVASWGVGQPLKLLRQYKKIIGREVEVVLKDGGKLKGILTGADEESITVEYGQMVAVEGKKRKELQTVIRTLSLAEVKTTKEQINFK